MALLYLTADLISTELSVPTTGLTADMVSISTVASVIVDSSTNQIVSPVVIGDDYLAANNRQFSFTINAPSGATAGASSCYLGFTDKCGNNLTKAGTITDNSDGTWTLQIEILDTEWQSTFTEGFYTWCVTVVDQAGREISTTRSARPLLLVARQTTI